MRCITASSSSSAAAGGNDDVGLFSAQRRLELVEAKFDFQPQQAGQVQIRVGDVAEVLDRTNGDWWKISINGQEGYVPASYISDPVAPPPDSRAPPPPYRPIGGGGVASFKHIAPNGMREDFTPADNALIVEAKKRGANSVRISDVRLASGATLRFEIRFGAAARSAKMNEPSRTGICQVNLDNENARIVEDHSPVLTRGYEEEMAGDGRTPPPLLTRHTVQPQPRPHLGQESPLEQVPRGSQRQAAARQLPVQNLPQVLPAVQRALPNQMGAWKPRQSAETGAEYIIQSERDQAPVGFDDELDQIWSGLDSCRLGARAFLQKKLTAKFGRAAGHDRFFWFEGLPPTILRVGGGNSVEWSAPSSAGPQIRWDKGDKKTTNGKTDIIVAVEMSAARLQARIPVGDLSTSLIISTTSTELAIVFRDQNTRDEFFTGCRAMLNYSRSLPRLLCKNRLPCDVLADMMVAAELQRALRQGPAEFADAQLSFRARALSERRAWGLPDDATDNEVVRARARAQAAASGLVLPMLLVEKVLPAISVQTVAAMTGPAAPWVDLSGKYSPPPIWLFDDEGDHIYGPTYSEKPGESAECHGWGLYDDDMVGVLEEARAEGTGAAVLVEGPADKPFSYIVDLVTMEQENTTTGKIRAVKRLISGGPGVASDAPPQPEPEGDDGECSVCFAGPLEFGISRTCLTHKFCSDCIRGTLDAALTSAQFPAMVSRALSPVFGVP